MLDWQELVRDASNLTDLQNKLCAGQARNVYPRSPQLVNGQLIFLGKQGTNKCLLIVGADLQRDPFQGAARKEGSFFVKKAPLDSENAAVLRKLFPWTAPQPFGLDCISLGLGDRLGLASPGHLKAVRDTGVKPVLAQQSMRELELTGRSYRDVLDAATFAVFQEGYQLGFGADGDHLKTGKDIQAALELGFSMITLDCSEHINNDAMSLPTSEILKQYEAISQERRKALEKKYLGKNHRLASGREIVFTEDTFKRMVLVYEGAITFAENIYREHIAPLEREIDFEISTDEVSVSTTPQDHYFVASELVGKGLKICGMAPRFCGAFEKGIDYIGDLKQFEAEYQVHAEIAEHYGYKVSIHSGSDKFSIFPIVSKYSGKRLHVKTAGTNWLEALRVIAKVDPGLFRELYKLGLGSIEKARRYYAVSLDITKIAEIDRVMEQDLPELLEQNDIRQALHITYGFMLTDPKYRVRIYSVLTEHEDLYRDVLANHIKKHLRTLGLRD